jgi:hypothetical protein
MGQVNFECGRDALLAIHRIAQRAAKLAKSHGIAMDVMELEMDLAAAHCNGSPLDFDKLWNFDNANFGHDVFGIRRFIDRETGELGGCFVPRCAERE